MKKTIYVPDDGTWERVEAAAAERNISISKLLLSSWVDSGMRLLDCDRLDRIEGKVDELITAANIFPCKGQGVTNTIQVEAK